MSEILQIGFTEDKLRSIVNDILQEALSQGASSAEVDVHANKGFSVTVRKGEIETVEYNQDKMIAITVYFGQRSGSASISDIRPEAMRSAVKAACNIARFTDEDSAAGLAEKELLAFNYPAMQLNYPWAISVEDAIDLAKLCEDTALSYDKRITNSEGATIATVEVVNVYGNTEGFIGIFPASRHELSCVLIATEKDEMQRDYSYTIACDPQMLVSPEKIAIEAAERTVRRLGGRKLSTRQSPVIFAAEEARGFLGHFVSANSGGSLYRQSSFLVNHLGQSIFPSHINIHEDPHLEKALGSTPFDEDGVKTQPNQFVVDGRLEKHVLSIYSARKLGMKTTGNAGGVHNLKINHQGKNLPDLLKTMNTGLYVTELMGQGVNLVTGDYSRGCAGFWVENGEIAYPVEEITIAGNLQDLYKNLVEVGSDTDKRGNIQTGSILLEQMTIAGE